MGKALVIKNVDFSENKLTTVTLGSAVPCTGLSLSESSVSFTSITSVTITATRVPANTTDTVAWSTSNPSVVTVSSGIVTAVGVGSATITATCGQQTATCSVSVVLDPEYVLVAGYNPSRRSTTSHGATLNVTTTKKAHVLAANNSSESVLPIEDKDNIDTGNWRFVPLVLPAGATGFSITSEYEFKTRIQWFDNTKVSDVNHKGAWVVVGNNSDNFDQSDWATTQTFAKPSDSGINSFGGCVYMRSHESESLNGNYADDITITYTYS